MATDIYNITDTAVQQHITEVNIFYKERDGGEESRVVGRAVAQAPAVVVIVARAVGHSKSALVRDRHIRPGLQQ